MKKQICIVLMLALIMALAACGAAQPEETTPPGISHFLSGEIEIPAGADAAPILEALGEPGSYTEAPSCAGAGVDKTYGYPGFFFTTYEAEGKDIIGTLWLSDDTAATPEGIRIGSLAAQVKRAYPDAAICAETYFINGPDFSLNIMTSNGRVTDIRYSAWYAGCSTTAAGLCPEYS